MNILNNNYNFQCFIITLFFVDVTLSYVLKLQAYCIYKNKNIFEKMSEYVGFSPPPTYFLHTLTGWLTIVIDHSA